MSASSDSTRAIALLISKSGMGHETFSAYWRDRHGPLVASTSDYEKYRLRYVQDHWRGDLPGFAPFEFNGLAQVEVPNTAEAARFAETWQYQTRILPDEQKFLDRRRSVALSVEDLRLRDGFGPVKAVVITEAKKRPLLAHFGAQRVSKQLSGWRVGVVRNPVLSMTGMELRRLSNTVALEEMWFPDEMHMREFFAWEWPEIRANREKLLGDLAVRGFSSEELVLFGPLSE